MLFEPGSPVNVFNSLDIITVQLERSQEVVESDLRVSGDVHDAESGKSRRRKGGEGGETGDMVNRTADNGIVDIRDKAKLDTALHHSPDEVIGVGN